MTPDVQQLQLQVDQATTLSRETGIRFGEAMMLVQRGEELGEPVTPEHVNPTYLGLLEDSQRLDEVVKVLEADLDLDYLGALEYLEDRFNQWEFASDEAREAVTLAQVLADSPVTIARVLSAACEQRPEVTMLARDAKTLLPEGEIVRGRDGKNVVKYPDDVDLDALIADPLNAKRAYRAASKLDGHQTLGGDFYIGLFEDFRGDWEHYANEGLDLVASMQLWKREAEIAELEDDEAVRREIEQTVQAAQDEGRLRKRDVMPS
jgi:hypothetical protein